jgi:hypothetical protein
VIQFRFVLGRDLASSAIALFSAGYFSHVDAVMLDGTLLGARADTIGGRPPGVQVRPNGYETIKRAVTFSLAVEPTQELNFYAFLGAQVGKPYDKTAIWAFVLGRDWTEPDSWFCSELLAAAVIAAGILRPLYFPPNKVTPAAFANILSELGALTYEEKTS